MEEAELLALSVCATTYVDRHVKEPFTRGVGHYGTRSPLPLVHLFSRICMRHSKLQSIGGQAVLSLPPKTESVVRRRRRRPASAASAPITSACCC